MTDTTRIEEAVTDHFGVRCEAFDPDCMSCQAWAEIQAIKDMSLRSASVGVKGLEWSRVGWVEALAAPEGLGVWYAINALDPKEGTPPFTLKIFVGTHRKTSTSEMWVDGGTFATVEAAKAAAQADFERRIRSALSAVPETLHPDDLAVDRFAVAMKAKLAKKRDEGRGGWDDKAECSADFLSRLLRDHVRKGDPLDVGNLAMMLHQRAETIAPETEGVGEPVAWGIPFGEGFINLTDNKSKASMWKVHFGNEVVPLYLSPQPAAVSVVDGWVKDQIRAKLEAMNAAGCLCVYEMADDRGLTVDEYVDLFAMLTAAPQPPQPVKVDRKLFDQVAKLEEACNQARLALSGMVSPQSALDLLDARPTGVSAALTAAPAYSYPMEEYAGSAR